MSRGKRTGSFIFGTGRSACDAARGTRYVACAVYELWRFLRFIDNRGSLGCMKRRVERFEDLIAWQRQWTWQCRSMRCRAVLDSHAILLCVIRSIAQRFRFRPTSPRVLSRGSRAEFHRFLSIAKGSCAELRTQIFLAQRIGYVDDPSARLLLADAEAAASVIGKLRMTVAKQRATPLMPHAAYRMP
jgi:hypothetical protein